MLADELAAIGRRLADPALEAQGLLLRMVAELETGRPRLPATHRQFDAVAEASRSPRLRFVAASRRGMVAALRADLARHVAEIDAARALGERIGEPDAVGHVVRPAMAGGAPRRRHRHDRGAARRRFATWATRTG